VDKVRTIATGTLALVCLIAVPAQAEPAVGDRSFVTGARLLEMCKTESPYCTGYVAGVADALAPLSGPGGPLPPNSLASYCPRKLTVRQAIIAFKKFARNNPEGLQIDAAQLVGDALHMAHPCERKKPASGSD
jgi:hypothetical protein